MLTLRDIMTPEARCLEPEMTLREAIQWLAAEGFSGAPVVAGGRLVGVVSASDILEFESSSPGAPTYRSGEQTFGEWGDPDSWEESTTEPPAAWFRDMWADSESSVVERISDDASPEWDFLADHVVAEVMTRKVVALAPGAGLQEAAKLMVRSGVHRILVTEDDVLVGIVSTMDFVRVVADGKLV